MGAFRSSLSSTHTKRLSLRERHGFVVAALDDDRHDPGCALVMPLDGALDLDLVHVAGVQEVGADQEDDEVGLVELALDRLVPLGADRDCPVVEWRDQALVAQPAEVLRHAGEPLLVLDRKSTRLNSSHANISYAVFCLK